MVISETYEPLECTVFLENQNRCFQFWSNVAERYAQKGIFEDRGGYPDKNAENIIKTELKSKNNLPYKVRLTVIHFESIEVYGKFDP